MTARRNLLLALVAGALSATLPSLAQQPVKIRRIGFLATRWRSTPEKPDIYYDAFMQGMRELGYVEGKNLAIEWRFAEGKFERLPALATELVQMNVEVIVVGGTPETQAAQRSTSTIPIIMTSISDPVGSGFAKSLARPGGNITGLSLMSPDISPKMLELLKTMLPKLSRFAILVNPSNPSAAAILEGVLAAARQFGIKAVIVKARTTEEIEQAFTIMARERVDACISLADPFFSSQRQKIVELAAKHRLPAMYGQREYVESGGLMSYSANFADLYRRAAIYVDKILKGAKPDDLPIEQPTRIHFAINRNTATALKLKIPQELLLRADEVID